MLCNFANADMVGHTGVLPAVIKAVETVDQLPRAHPGERGADRRAASSSRPTTATAR